MSNWTHTTILHEPRKLLRITVLEYTVLDVIYHSQTSPIYSVHGWSKNGCHQLGEFVGCSSGTIKALFDRMETMGYLEFTADRKMKRTTESFYGVAYEKDKGVLEEIPGCSKTERVQKLNILRSKTEQRSVQKLNAKCSKTEHKRELKENFNLIEEEIVETSSTPFLSENEIEDIEQQIYASKATEKNPTPQVAPTPRPKAKRAKVDNPAPIREMFDIYSDQYAKMNGGEKPEFMPKYYQPMKKLYGILEARQIQSGIVPLDKLQPWRDFIEMWGKFLQDHPKETYFTANFNPATFYSQFNTIVAKMKNQPKTTAQKWEQFYRENMQAQ